MHVLLLTDGLHPFVIGGMQKHSTILARKLNEKGIEVTVVHCGGDGYSSEKFRQEIGEGVNEILVPFEDNSKLPGHYLRATKKYAKRIVKAVLQLDKFDLIYAQGFTGLGIGNRDLKTPILLNLHGLEMFQISTNFKSRIDAIRLRKMAKKAIKISDYVYSFGAKIDTVFRELNVSNERILHQMNGIDESWLIENNKVQKKECRNFIFIGRDERRKGIAELKQATHILGKQTNHFAVEFVGPISRSNLDTFQNITFHGVIKNQVALKAILDKTDCLICPSYSEGMPTVIAEAMARGLAVIATDVGAVSRQFSKNGVLLSKSTPDGIAAAMRQLMGMNAEEFYQLKLNSLEKAKADFTWESIVNSKIKDFKKVLS